MRVAKVTVEMRADPDDGAPIPETAVQDALHFVQLDLKRGATSGSVTLLAGHGPGAYHMTWRVQQWNKRTPETRAERTNAQQRRDVQQ